MNAANNLINNMVWLKYLQVPHAVPEVQGKRLQEQANSDGVHPQEEGREDEDKDAQVRVGPETKCMIHKKPGGQ